MNNRQKTPRKKAIALAIASAAAIAVLQPLPVLAQSSYLDVTRIAPDWRLEHDAADALARRASLAGSSIDVTVKGGIAELDGSVYSNAQRKRAEEVVASTRGIRRVQNDLKVEGDGSDAAAPQREPVEDDVLAKRLAEKVAKAIPGAQVDDDLFFGYEVEGDNWQFEVNADEGDVSLDGTVPEPGLVREVIAMVRQDPGVRRVDADLEADERRGYTSRRDTRGPALRTGGGDRWAGDSWVGDRLFAKIAGSASLLGSRIESSVEEGVATLKGAVSSDRQKTRAERIARQMEGVRDVNNELEIDQSLALEREPVEDDVLSKRLAEALIELFPGARLDEGWFYGYEIEGANWELEISSDEGEVTLNGSVPTPADVRKVLETVGNDRGVRAIDSDVEAEHHQG